MQPGTSLVVGSAVGDEVVAVTVWGDWVSPLFDVSLRVRLLTIVDGRLAGNRELELPRAGPDARLAVLRDLRVTTVFCGAISEYLLDRAAAEGIAVAPYRFGRASDVVETYLSGTVPDDATAEPEWR